MPPPIQVILYPNTAINVEFVQNTPFKVKLKEYPTQIIQPLPPGVFYAANIYATNAVFVGNSTVNVSINSTSFSGTSNNSIHFGNLTLANVQAQITGNAATAFSNAVSTSASGAALIYQTMAGLSANVATLTSNNSTNFGGLSLATVQGQITGNAATAYTNAAAYADTKASAAYSNAIAYSGNASLAYANAIAYADNKAANAYSNAVAYADAKAANAYSNAIAYSGNAVQAYTNATVFASNADNISSGTLNTARLPATVNISSNINVGANLNVNTSVIQIGNSSVNTSISAATITINGVNVNTAITSNAATAYSNAAAYADSKAATAYSNAATYADNKAANAYSNAIAYADDKAANAYSNATTFASNATNITSGTLNTARLPATVNVATALNIGSNVNVNTSVIQIGNSTVNTVINSSSIVTSSVTFGNTNVTGDLIVSGNVFFNGPTTNVNSTNLVIEDKNIILGDVATPSDFTADGGGITLKGATDKTLTWVDSTDAWTSSEDFNLVSGKSYEINGVVVVNSTSLGTGILSSSLTSVGNLTTLNAGNTTITGFANISSHLTVGGNATFSGNVDFDSGTLFIDSVNNRIGISNTSPSSKFVIQDSLTANDTSTVLIAPTWNATANTFTAFKINATDTASNSNSLLMDLQVGGSSKFKVSKAGIVTASDDGYLAGGRAWFSQYGAFLKSDAIISWGNATSSYSGADTILARDAAGILAQRNGTNAQALRVYDTYTDASNYERVVLSATENNLGFVGYEAAGTGSNRNFAVRGAQVLLQTNGSNNRWIVDGTGHFTAATDNTYDIGASGANRPRNVHVAGYGSFGTYGGSDLGAGGVSVSNHIVMIGSSSSRSQRSVIFASSGGARRGAVSSEWITSDLPVEFSNGSVLFAGFSNTGNFGISNSAPTHKLSVNGNVYFGSTLDVLNSVTSGNLSVTGFVNASVSVNSALVTVGSNVSLNTTTLSIGNSTVNTAISAATITINGVNVNTAITSNAATAYSNAIAYSGNAALAYANAASYADTKAATAYSNAIAYSGNAALAYANATTFSSNADNISSGTLNTARLPSTVNVSSVLNVGSNVNVNTSVVFIGNSTVNTAISAATITINGVNVNTAITSNAATAYSNATAYADTKAATAYSNATAYADTKAATAYSNAAAYADTKAATAYSNAIAYSGNAALAYSNATTFASNADNITSGTLNTARLPSTVNVASVVNIGANVSANTSTVFVGNSTVNTSISAATITINGVNVNTAITSNAATAYSNAVTYADNKAATAYSNATTYADTKAATAYSNATTYADTKAATAYSNATAYADTKASAAYSNAVAYAASNTYVNSTFLQLSGGTMTGNLTINASANVVSNLAANNVTIRGNVQIDGNLVVSGTTVTISATELAIEDNMIYLNDGSTVSNPDLGFAGNYNDGTYRHAGFFRDASDGVWKVFDNYEPEPDASAYIDTSNSTFRIANFQANVITANSFTGNGSNITTINADSISSGTLNTARLPATVNVSTAFNIGSNVNANTSTLFIGNSTVNTVISAATITINGVNVNTAITSNAVTAYSNAIAYSGNAALAYANAVSYADTKASAAYSNAIAYSGNAALAYANAASYADSKAATAYSNAISYSGNAALAYANAASYADTKAATAYSNATSYADTKAATAYSNAIAYSGNAALAYSNATSFASNADNISSGTLNTARLPATVNVSTVLNVGANLNVNTSTIQIGNSTVNTVISAATITINGVNVNTAITSNAATAYSNAIAYSGNAALAYANAASYADSKAATAYSNATSYADTKAATAYSNATSYADTKAATAYSNATAYADTKAATAYSNAISYSGNAALAYANATAFSSNADNISSGTLNTARLPATVNVATALNVGANVSVNTSVIQFGNSTVNTVISPATITINGVNVNTAITSNASAAYSNAIAYSGNAALAYANATAFSSNADNISSGTLNTARLPATVNVTSAINIGANVNANTSTIQIGNSTVNTVISAATITINGVNVNTAITSNAATAYSNAIAYSGNAALAYSNATTFASNANNISSGTLNTARLPATVNVTSVLNVGSNVNVNTSVIQIGNSTVNTVINSSSIATGSGTFGNTTITGDLVVSGNVFFNGPTTNVNSTNLVVEDKNIVLGDVTTPSDVTADGGGITLKGATDKTFNWVDATDAWTSSEHLNLVSTKSYQINGAVVVNSTALGTGIVSSSLTSVGTLTTLSTGNTTVTGFANVSSTLQVGGNATLSGTLQTISGNVNIDSGTLFVDATNDRVAIGNTSPDSKFLIQDSLTANGSSTFNINPTWNATANTFTAVKLNVTDTASNASSLLMDLQIGGSKRFYVGKSGSIIAFSTAAGVGISTANNGNISLWSGATVGAGNQATYISSGRITVGASGQFSWGNSENAGSTEDLFLFRDAANILAQRNSTNTQTFRIYETFTDASNYSRMFARVSGGIAEIGTEAAGSGTLRPLYFSVGGATSWYMSTSRHFLAGLDNTYDIGASGASRPRTGYFGTHVYIGSDGYYYHASRSAIGSPASGVHVLLNSGGTDYSRLQFGGTTSSFPALKRVTTSLEARLADDSGYATFRASNLIVRNDSGILTFGASDDVILIRDAGNTLAQRNSTTAQAFRVYNTFTDASNYERAKIAWESNVLRIGTEKAGSGSARVLELQTDGTTRLTIGTGGTSTFSAAVLVGSNSPLGWSARSRMMSASNGIIAIYNDTETDFGRLQFGGTTSSFPALKRNGTAINVRLADDSADAPLTASQITHNTNFVTTSEATTLATTTKTQVASFASASFRSGKLMVQAYDSVTGEVQISELLVAHNGTTASSTEYGVVFTGAAALATYDVDISAGNVRLMATRTTTNSTQYKTSEMLLIA